MSNMRKIKRVSSKTEIKDNTASNSKTKTKKLYVIDGLTYDSRPLYNYHIELKGLTESGLVRSFSLPVAGEENKNKYKAHKPFINDIQFDSINESKFYVLLLKHQRTGRIRGFEMQKRFVLIPSHIKRGKKYREMAYIADFVVHGIDGLTDIIDVKGFETPEFTIKHKIFEYVYPDLELVCYQYSETNKKWLTLDEVKKMRREKKAKEKKSSKNAVA